MKYLTYLIAFFLMISSSCTEKNDSQTKTTLTQEFQKSAMVQNTVMSEGHPMAVWEKKVTDTKGIILFVHGRTWSSVPDFDLQVANENLSLMDGMNEQGYTTYAVDLRGYGETPRDSTDWNSPNKAAKDVSNVIDWISSQNGQQKIHLFGWSMGSTISLLVTQQAQDKLTSLTVFGYWLDLDNMIPADSHGMVPEKRVNTAEAAASDFITPGSISQKAIDQYVKTALKADPIRADWRYQNQYNEIDPSLIQIPVLILQGELDPIGSTDRQTKLFTRLKTADKSWVVISGGDHAAFMETPRPHFIKSFTDFIDRFD